MIYHSTGINLWKEWAKLEVRDNYQLPKIKNDYAGIIQSLTRQKWPYLDSFTEQEVKWRLKKKKHAGIIIASNRNYCNFR